MEPQLDIQNRQRICAAVREVKPFTQAQEQNSARLIQYARQHHLPALMFYARYGQAVAKVLVEKGEQALMVEFERIVHELSLGEDLEPAYRYYRDQFMVLYDFAFPNATGQHVDAAREYQRQEHEREAAERS